MRNELRSFTTACRYMWILQDQDGNEYGHSAGIGPCPQHLITEALSSEGRARGLEIWAETYGLIGRGKELGYVPLDNDAAFIQVRFDVSPEWGRKERSLYWITAEWFKELERPGTVAVNPWAAESARRIAYRQEFLDVYVVRTENETFTGHLNECEEWMIERRFPMMDDAMWNTAIEGEIAEWPGEQKKVQLTIERIK